MDKESASTTMEPNWIGEATSHLLENPLQQQTVTVGKFKNYYYSVTIDYSSVALDELLFHNVKLTSDQIRELYNQGFS